MEIDIQFDFYCPHIIALKTLVLPTNQLANFTSMYRIGTANIIWNTLKYGYLNRINLIQSLDIHLSNIKIPTKMMIVILVYWFASLFSTHSHCIENEWNAGISVHFSFSFLLVMWLQQRVQNQAFMYTMSVKILKKKIRALENESWKPFLVKYALELIKFL